MRFLANANYPFLSWRRRAYLASAIMLGIGLVGIAVNLATVGSWLIYGVDFTGGMRVQVDFVEPVQADDLRSVNPDWQISSLGEPSEYEYLIRAPTFADPATNELAAGVPEQLTQAFGADAFEIEQTEAVGPSVGEELQQRALLAILLAFGLTLIYLAWRFEWRFGAAAILATVHDIVITLGFLAVLRTEISVGIVAAFLTILGYSLNDKIVVFDRVRENLHNRPRGLGFRELIDKSINETLPRTLLTGPTTLATLVSLLLFGGEVNRDFALVLILGIIVGTMSSIFIASPILVAIHDRWPRRTRKPAFGVATAR
jgi:preprotein translocase subunit SecF